MGQGIILNEKQHSLQRSLYIVREIKSTKLRWAVYVTRMEQGKRPLGKPRLRWEENIRMDPKEIGINTRNWAQDRDYWRALVNAALNFRIP